VPVTNALTEQHQKKWLLVVKAKELVGQSDVRVDAYMESLTGQKTSSSSSNKKFQLAEHHHL
jgi:hypothetical protein